MKILSNNLNYKNNLFIQNRNNVSFGELDLGGSGNYDPDDGFDDAYIPHRKMESSKILAFIKANALGLALEVAKKQDFAPNYQDPDTQKPLLISLYDARPSKFNPFNIFNRKKYDILMDYVALNYRFNPNIQFDRDYKKDDFELITPVEYFIEKNDYNMVSKIVTNVNFEDPFCDDMKTLMQKTKNTNIKTLLELSKVLQDDVDDFVDEEIKRDIPGTRDCGDDNSSSLKSIKVRILESDPKNLDEIGGMKETKSDINEFIVQPWSTKYREKIKQGNIDMPNGFLMTGPPGCGKTYIVKAIANQMNINMYSMDFANIGESLAYKTQQKIKKVFDALEAKYISTGKPSILFLDEVDAICGDRDKMHTDWKIDDVDAVLVQLNNAASKGIILIGATNRSEAMDKAAKRPGRFDQEIFVGYPTKEDRQDMITKLLKTKETAKKLLPDIDKIVDITEDCSYADISCLINTACRRAVINDKDYASFEDLPILLSNIRKKNQAPRKIGLGV